MTTCSAHMRGMTIDSTKDALTSADPTLAEHPELLERFIAAAQAAGILSAPTSIAEGLNCGEIVALLDSFDDMALKVSVDGMIGTPGLYRFGTGDDGITAHFYRVPAYRVNVREFSDQLAAIAEVCTQAGSNFTVDVTAPVRFTDTDSTSPGWWIVTGAEEFNGHVQLILKAESRA